MREKNYNQDRTAQDRTIKKSQRRKNPRKDIAMKFGKGVTVPEVVTWADFDLENLMGVKFTGGHILGFSVDFAMGLNTV